MAGKRKRGEGASVEPFSQDSTHVNRKPLSAVAAAKLKIATAEPVIAIDDTQETAANVPVESSDSSYAESEPSPPPPSTPHNFKLCTWRPDSSNTPSKSDSELSIILQKHDTVSFIGCYEFKILKGAININGANLGAVSRLGESAKVHRAFVPSTHPITKIRGLDGTNHVQFLNCKEPTPFAGISPLFDGIWNIGKEKEQGRSFALVTESNADPLNRPLTPELAPKDWVRGIEDCASTPSITLITGPSSSGKSTFAKRLLNRYLTGLGKTAKALSAVCYLELDLNKPEYSSDGQVSLTIVREVNLGPSFTHPVAMWGREAKDETVRTHSIPMHGLAKYEDYYKSCIEDLFQTYQTLALQNPSLPLIINTPPFFYTTHFPLLVTLLSRTKTNNLVHLGNITAIDTETAIKLDTLQTLSRQHSTTIHEITACNPPLPPPRTDAELRAMQMQSYFHLTGSKKCTPFEHMQPIWNPRPLSTTTPWEFSYEETGTRTQDFIGFLPLNEPIPPSQLFTALNGSIIHIVETSDPTIQQRFSTLPRTPKYCLPYFEPNGSTGMTDPLCPSTSRLVCTALIRGFDPANRIVQILVPKPHEGLLLTIEAKKTVFVAGCCDMPEWAYREDGYYQTSNRPQNAAGGRHVGEHEVDLPPWVQKWTVVEGMGYLNTVRRVRKFQQ